MYKIFAILLSNLILLQSLHIGLEDFSKAKVLINHIQYHQDTYGDNLLDFFAEHYGTKEHQGNNHKEHQRLPFKDSSTCFHHVISSHTINTQVFEIKNTIVLQRQQNYFCNSLYSFIEKTSVFQPPKNA